MSTTGTATTWQSTTQSHSAPIYYVDLCIRVGVTLEAATTKATTPDTKRMEASFDQKPLDEAAQQVFYNCSSEESAVELPRILEKFSAEGTDTTESGGTVRTLPQQRKHSLKEKLEQRTAQSGKA